MSLTVLMSHPPCCLGYWSGTSFETKRRSELQALQGNNRYTLEPERLGEMDAWEFMHILRKRSNSPLSDCELVVFLMPEGLTEPSFKPTTEALISSRVAAG